MNRTSMTPPPDIAFTTTIVASHSDSTDVDLGGVPQADPDQDASLHR
jgi:hypothetical protein